MRSWPVPPIPDVPADDPERCTPCLHDTATDELVVANAGDRAQLYVCGITPYDATHLGHAATYLGFDTLVRVWRDAGLAVRYAQNITDVDDPLLERATRDGVDWRDLAAEQIDLFRADMASLGVIPPDDYVAVTEVTDRIADAVDVLLRRGTAYRVDTPDAAGDDVYFDIAAAGAQGPWRLGQESGLDRATMLALSAERGGDPDRAGKHDPLDPLLWRAARDNEPSWESSVGKGRPGWHIECSVIALDHLGADFTVQGGGSDLIFPHHEMSAGHAAALSGHNLARVYAHSGMVAYQGEKMSKSLGNLVLVSRLREAGVDPRAIRLAVLDHHYRSDWEWTDAELDAAEGRLATWADASTDEDRHDDRDFVDEFRRVIRRDLDTPAAIRMLDDRVSAGTPLTPLVRSIADALLGIRIA